MPKFTPLELTLFIENTCGGCKQTAHVLKTEYQRGNGCPHLRKAVVFGKMPGAWERKRFGALGETFKCSDFTAVPPSTRRGKAADETAPMFEVDEGDKHLVPVEGWPDYQALKRKQKDGDHQ